MHLRLFAIVMSFLCEVIRMGSSVVQRQNECRSSDCEQCFNQDFCTKCKPGFRLYRGKCLIRCPEGTFTHQADCLEECPLALLGEWSEWSVCSRDGTTCGFRWGKQTRLRPKIPSERTSDEKEALLCPTDSETQRCRMRKKCPTEKRRNKKGLGRKKEKKRLRQLAISSSSNSTTDSHREP